MNSDVTIELDSNLKFSDEQTQAVSLYDEVNPNLKREFTIVFEVPNESNYGLGVSYQTDKMLLKLK